MQKSLILSLFILTLFSCSKEEVELTLAEKVVGNWTGLITQESCCTFKIDVRINELIENEEVATGNYYDTDHTICDDDIYFCEESKAEPPNCSFSWSFNTSNGTSITFIEEHAETDICGSGTVTLRLINDDMLSYEFKLPGVEDDISGTLSRQ